MTTETTERFRIPSMERILSSGEGTAAAQRWGRVRLRDAIREILAEVRARRSEPPSIAALVAEAVARLSIVASPSLRRVVNATGVIIHTNLGRSPLAGSAVEGGRAVLERYSNLELDLGTGARGRRHSHLDRVTAELFGCEAALLVNNNAAGILLVLAALSSGREVIVSRGELVEIGGSFRVPEVIEQGGAILREVGTTNRTRASDYRAASGERTGAVLSVHRSNFEIVGFTESPSVEDLIAAAREAGVPYVIDEGSGRVVDLARYGFSRRETLRELIELGADVVTCSSDKLIGASQGGLILGRRELVERCARHPLTRALRPGKESFALVAATLDSFARNAHEDEVPIYRMLSSSISDLEERARRIAPAHGEIVSTAAVLGGGTTPAESMPSVGIRIAGDAVALHAALLARDLPILARIEDDALLLDVRTIFEDEEDAVREALAG